MTYDSISTRSVSRFDKILARQSYKLDAGILFTRPSIVAIT